MLLENAVIDTDGDAADVIGDGVAATQASFAST